MLWSNECAVNVKDSTHFFINKLLSEVDSFHFTEKDIGKWKTLHELHLFLVIFSIFHCSIEYFMIFLAIFISWMNSLSMRLKPERLIPARLEWHEINRIYVAESFELNFKKTKIIYRKKSPESLNIFDF